MGPSWDNPTLCVRQIMNQTKYTHAWEKWHKEETNERWKQWNLWFAESINTKVRLANKVLKSPWFSLYCISLSFTNVRDFPGGSGSKESAMQETQVQSLGWEDPLEKGMVTHSSILAWWIPWTDETGELQFMGSQRVGHN